MIGTTNIISKKGEVEKINLTLMTDQSSHDVLVGKSFTVSYEEYSKTYTWEGLAVTFEVPAYVAYTISFSDVSGYITPSSITNTAQAGNSRTLNVVYGIKPETLTVKVSGLSSGFTVSVINATTGATIDSQTATSKTYSIPAGTKYYVKASSYSGYNTPSNSSTYTAVGNGTRTVTVTYTLQHTGTTNPSNGVYIQDTDGYFHTEAEWDGTYTADCVAVITDACRFGIALTGFSTMKIHNSYSSSGALEKYMTAIPDETQAKADYDGATNTTNIMKLQSSTNFAAGWCNAFSFPSGKNGFLPSLGQMWAAYNNKAAVDAALIKVGGTALPSEYHYWTSTFWGVNNYGVRYCWVLNWSGGVIYATLVDNRSVRAFCSI